MPRPSRNFPKDREREGGGGRGYTTLHSKLITEKHSTESVFVLGYVSLL